MTAARSASRQHPSETRCPVCDSSHFQAGSLSAKDRQYAAAGAFEEYTYSLCCNCRALFMNPMPRPEDIWRFYPPSEEYYAHRSDVVPRTYRMLAHSSGRSSLASKAVRHTFFPFVPFEPPGRVLDYGCGAGHFLDAMSLLEWETWGVEPAKDAAELAAKSHEVICGTAEDAGRQLPGEYDLITMFQVLEHITDPVDVLRILLRLLRPGGRLVLSTPNSASSLAHATGTLWRGLECPRHVCLYGPLALHALMEACGGRIVDARTRLAPSDAVDTLLLCAQDRFRRTIAPRTRLRARQLGMMVLAPTVLVSSPHCRPFGSLLEAAITRG
jgi:SAM-dependent methyltransferase